MRETLSRYVARSQRGVLTLFLCLGALFVLLEFGLGVAYGWMDHDRCFSYLGCNIGAYGFDALVHFTSGLATGVFFALVIRGSLRDKTLRRHLFDLLVFGFCVVLAWELVEWIGDALRIGELYGNLLYAANTTFQLSGWDTFGDIAFGSLGTFLAGVLGIVFRKEARAILRRPWHGRA